jgi:methyl-accepting chemotaxis protein
MSNPFRRSLALSATLLIIIAATCGVMMTLLVGHHLASERVENEGRAIEALAEKRLSERLAADIRQARFRLDMLGASLEDGLAVVASDPRIREALVRKAPESGWPALQADLARLGFSDGVVFDYRLEPVMTSRPRADLAGILAHLDQSGLLQPLSELLDSATTGGAETLRLLVDFDPDLHNTLETETRPAGLVVAAVMRNDLRDIVGVALAIRPIRMSEPFLTDLARINGLGLSLVTAGRVLSMAGPVEGHDALPHHAGDQLFRHPAAPIVARCEAFASEITVCISRPQSEITDFRNELAAIGVAGSRRSILLLSAVCLAGLLVLGLVAWQVARWFTRPLVEISHGLDTISAGDFRSTVPHVEREDEIGRIARAVSTMQVRLDERDRMRAEMIRIDAMNQRRQALGAEFHHFETSVARVLGNLATVVDGLAASEIAIAQATRATDEQASHIVASSQATASSARVVNGATMHLSEGLSEISSQTRRARDAVNGGRLHLEQTADRFGKAEDMARAAGAEIEGLRDAVADVAANLLRRTSQAAFSGADRFGSITRDAAERADLAAKRVAALLVEMDDGSAALHAVREGLEDARLAAGEIAVTTAEQGAATRAIATGLAETSIALENLTAATETLRENLTIAQRATQDFVESARRIAEETRLIDEGIRLFVQQASRT